MTAYAFLHGVFKNGRKKWGVMKKAKPRDNNKWPEHSKFK